MERFDVAVVGAGPAGSTTAYRLALARARVLLVDKARFPRDKPCGGGLTMRAVRQLPFPVEQAVGAGAEFRDGARVTIESERELRVDGEPVEVEALIGADGANGITARTLGLGGGIVNGVALEGNLPYKKLPPGGWRGMLVLELATVPGGYGWIFPKGDHVNVGVGGWGEEGPRLRQHLG